MSSTTYRKTISGVQAFRNMVDAEWPFWFRHMVMAADIVPININNPAQRTVIGKWFIQPPGCEPVTADIGDWIVKFPKNGAIVVVKHDDFVAEFEAEQLDVHPADVEGSSS